MEEYINLIESSHKINSLVVCTSLNNCGQKTKDAILNKSFIRPDITNGLHMMNGFYLYTNPPPYGYGTPAPYVAETIIRAYEFANINGKSGGEKTLNGYKIIDSSIDDLNDFPESGTTGSYHAKTVELYSKNFLNTHYEAIIETAKEVIQWASQTNLDILSKGRQTWDPAIKKSTTCAKAFNSFVTLLKENTGRTPTSLFEGFILWYELYNKTFLFVTTKTTKMKTKYKFNKSTNQRVRTTVKINTVRDKKINGNDECVKWLDNYTRSFCSYIKHAERGKKDRRAIASGSIAMRMHLKIVEEFHLRLANRIPGSTISIGGEEKKRKISNELEQATLNYMAGDSLSLQGTEDATKWNECLNPMLFALVHKTWFDPEVRSSMGLPVPSSEEKAFLKICTLNFFFMSIKRIHLGLGFQVKNETNYTRRNWHSTDGKELNTRNKKWFYKIKDNIDDDDYVSASPGFLMGMLNAASTTIGLIPITEFKLEGCDIRCLRSSDDSMTVFTADSTEKLEILIRTAYSLYRLFGINPSKEKSILFPPGYGEYTSWYQDRKFIGQCGVETSSLKPEGNNAQDDFNSNASKTLNLMRTYVINALGAIARISIGAHNVRRLWNIEEREETEKEGIRKEVRFMADGGTNPWVIENLAIDEATIKKMRCSTQQEKEYFYKIMDPDNPFTEPPEEELLFSRDIGTLVSAIRDTPRNAFCYIRRSNRTQNNKMSEKESNFEIANQEAFEIATTVDPSFHLSIPSNKSTLALYLASNLALFKDTSGLTNSEQTLITRAINRLTQDPSQNDEDLPCFDDFE